MDSTIVWLLDVTVEQNAATLWIKTTDERILRLTDTYHPRFYILSKDERTGLDLFHELYIINAGWRLGIGYRA